MAFLVEAFEVLTPAIDLSFLDTAEAARRRTEGGAGTLKFGESRSSGVVCETPLGPAIRTRRKQKKATKNKRFQVTMQIRDPMRT
jgi:hypothetical protein